MTINSIQKKILEVLWNQEKVNINDLLTENDKKVQAVFLKKQAQILYTVLPKIILQSTEFENMEILNINEDAIYLYKEWEIFITDLFAMDGEVLSEFILPYINYNIIYQEAQENNIDYYNDDLDLQSTAFYEIQNEALILHISTYIEKYFGSGDLYPPQVKVILNFKNPLTVLT